MLGPGFGPPPNNRNDDIMPEKPKNIKDVPRFLKELFGGFFARLFYIFGLVWETGPWIFFVMLFMAVFNGVIPVISATITAEILNALAEGFGTLATEGTIGNQILSLMQSAVGKSIIFWLIAQLALTFIRSIVTNIDTILSRIYGELVVNHIKLKIMNKAKDVDLASFDTTDFYEKLENANREAGMRPIQILKSTFTIFSTLITLVSFIVVLIAVSPIAPVVIIALAIPSAIINFIYRKKNVDYIRRRSKDRRIMNYYNTTLTNKDLVKEIKMFSLSDIFIGRYKETFNRYFKGLKKLFVTEGIWHIALTVINAAVNCAIFAYIAIRVCSGDVLIGNYSLYVAALNGIASGVATLISTAATIFEGTLFIDNMIVFMKNKKTIVPSVAKPLIPERRVPHFIEFKNVSFKYPETDKFVIKDVSFKIEPSETVVLVGLNGAGKTTLVKLLTRLYDPTEGQILLDGHDIKEYDVDALYSMFGIIFQDFGKYAVSVKENIAFGDFSEKLDEEKVKNAAIASDADEFIGYLPDGYDTQLMKYFDDKGIEPSIGQWQKLSIARAFYSDSDILILDEPTASLDPMAEQEVFSRFDELRKDKTSIFVSHRLSSATTADKILVLEYGKLIEQGSHKELMMAKGKYHALFTTQAKRYIENSAPNDMPPPPNMMHRPPQMPPFPKNDD